MQVESKLNRQQKILPQFSVRTLLLLFTFAAATFALWKTMGGYATIVVAVSALTIFAHVAGNAIGTSMRDKTDAQRAAEIDQRKRQETSQRIEEAKVPTTELHGRKKLSNSIWVATLAGGILGALFGGTMLIWLNWETITLPNVFIGYAATGILGGFAFYLATSFAQVAGSALQQATKSDDDENEAKQSN